MTRGLSRSATALLASGVFAAALTIPSNARAENLRIGFIAPMTGIFAQVGKDMVNGFQMYLDEHGGKLGGMDVKFIVEDNQGKPDAAVPRPRSSRCRTRCTCSSAACWPRPAMRWRR